MNKENIKRLTLDDFRKKAIEKIKNRCNVVYLPVEGYGEVEFNRPSDDDLLEYLDEAAKGARMDKQGNVTGANISPIAQAAKVLVYKSCKYLHDSELHQELELAEPYDIVFKLFGIDVSMSLAEKISDTFGSNEVTKDIKN